MSDWSTSILICLTDQHQYCCSERFKYLIDKLKLHDTENNEHPSASLFIEQLILSKTYTWASLKKN